MRFKGENLKKKKKRDREPIGGPDNEEDADLLELVGGAASSTPMAGEGQLTTSGVVVMGVGTNFSGELAVGDAILVTVFDRYRDLQSDEQRIVNMVLGKTSLNLEAPFSCDVTTPASFMYAKRKPDVDALRAARAEEKKRAKKLEAEASQVTYKVLKAGSGTWKTWETRTETVAAGTSREDMLRRRASEKADRHCK